MSNKTNMCGDCAKLREALAKILSIADHVQMRFAIPELDNLGILALKQIAEAALAEPVRNCDVGSVAEQKERFKDFCKEGKLSRIDLGAYCAYDCPCRDSYDCKLEWAQMPYEEGGEK